MTEVDREVRHETRRHLTHIARGGALGLVGAGVTAVAGFGLVLVVTNSYSTDVAGNFFTVISAFMLMAAIATLGTETGLGRFLLRYEAHDRRGDIPPTLRAAFRPTIVYSVVLAIAVIAFAEPLSNLIGLDDPEGPASLRVLAVLLPLVTWNALTLAGTRAFGRIRPTVMVDKIGRPISQPLLVLVASLLAAKLLGMTIAWAIPYAIAALVSWWLFRRFLRRRGTYQHTNPTKSYKDLKRDFWRFTWPRSITSISQMAIQRMDIILIAALRSPMEAAIYTAATRFVAMGQFGVQAIQQVLQPKFTALLAHQRHQALKDVYRISAAWSMVVAWPMYMVVLLAPAAYLGLFGREYVDHGVWVVVVMAIAMLFAVATGSCDTLLLMSGRSALSLGNSLTALLIDIGLCVLLIPRMGIAGAALAWGIAVSSRCLLALIQVRVTMSILSFGPASAFAALANVVAFGVPILVVELLADLNFFTLLVVLAGCIPLYALFLWFGRRLLMLDVLRGLIRRSQAKEDDRAEEPQREALPGA